MYLFEFTDAIDLAKFLDSGGLLCRQRVEHFVGQDEVGGEVLLVSNLSSQHT